jgi:hypothetical protein
VIGSVLISAKVLKVQPQRMFASCRILFDGVDR